MLRLTRVRTKKGWSQSRLSKESGVHVSSISAIERGRLNPWPGQVQRIAEALEWQGNPTALLEDVTDDARD